MFFAFLFCCGPLVWAKLLIYFLENFDVGIGAFLPLLLDNDGSLTQPLSCGLGPHAAPTICTKFK